MKGKLMNNEEKKSVTEAVLLEILGYVLYFLAAVIFVTIFWWMVEGAKAGYEAKKIVDSYHAEMFNFNPNQLLEPVSGASISSMTFVVKGPVFYYDEKSKTMTVSEAKKLAAS